MADCIAKFVAKNSMVVALRLGVITYDCAVRVDTIRYVDDVIVGCLVARRLYVSVFVYVVDWFAFRSSWVSTYVVVAFGVNMLSTCNIVYIVD